MLCRRTLGIALALGLLGGCIEYEPVLEQPELGVFNPQVLEGDHQTDTIVQTSIPEVDVLWVVDNSCSMQEEQDGIAANFPVFLEYFQQTGLDWHIGVVSTDMGDPLQQGKLQSHAGRKWVDDTTPFPSDVLAGMTRLGTSGSGRERGRDAAWYALDQHRDGANAGFYRGSAALHVVVISDEDDDSELIGEDEFLEFMRRLKWGEDQLTFSSIVSESPTCPEAYVPGIDYMRYTGELGGIWWSICNDDWATVLRQLGIQAVQTSHEYYLSRIPVPDTIEVRVVAGDTSFEFERDTDWTYNPVRNSVTFAAFEPDAGMQVEIDYEILTGVTMGTGTSQVDPTSGG